jgi:hypothetical protein
MFQTREQLQHKIYKKPHSVYSEAMNEIFRREEKCSSVGYHSDVYYVRAAMEKRCGLLFPLFLVEAAMKKEGWRG